MEQHLSEISNIWNRVLANIKEEISNNSIFDSFFKDSYINSIEGINMYVVVTSMVAVQLIKAKYLPMINSAVHRVTQSNYSVVVISSSDAEKKKVVAPKVDKFFQDSRVDQRFTFDSFVVGPSNRETFQACLTVATNLGVMFNPLFIYSDSGLGKTHLLHAVGNYIKYNFPRKTVLFFSVDQLVDEYQKAAIGEKNVNELKAYIKNFDCLLIDDIQFLANKKKTEEFFFPIFNDFVNNNKQIVITCDRLPSELSGLEQRLVTRFSQGLLTKISKPETSVCVEILKRKIVSNGLLLDNFDEAAINFLAETFSSSVRDLEGAFLKLLNYTINFKPTNHITLEIAVESVQGILSNNSLSSELSEKKIINIVADYYNLTSAQILGRSHIKQITLARHICMYLIRNLLDIPFAKIGELFGGKDHSTVMSGINKVDNLLKTDQEMGKVIKILKLKING